MKKIIRKDIFEIHKPSAMITMHITRPVIKHNRIVGSATQLLPLQHDLMNFLCYKAKELLMTTQKTHDLTEFNDDTELFNYLQIQEFTIDITDIISFISSYQTSADKKFIFKQLKNLNQVQAELGIFKQDKMLGEIYKEKTFSLLRNYTRVGNSNIFSFQLEPEVLLNWVSNPNPYTKLYLTVQTKLKLTYSKILYEVCKDYEKLKSVTKNYKLWLGILGIEDNSNTKTPGKLKAFYLKKAIKEINEHTDIFIDDIFGTKKDGEATMTVLFHKQKCDLIDGQKELPIEEQIIQNKLNHKSKNKLLKLEKTGYIVKDEEAWMKADINNNKELYEAQCKLDDYVNLLNGMEQQERLTLLGGLAKFVKATDPVVLINNDYILTDLSGNPLTTNAIETRKVIMGFQEKEQDV